MRGAEKIKTREEWGGGGGGGVAILTLPHRVLGFLDGKKKGGRRGHPGWEKARTSKMVGADEQINDGGRVQLLEKGGPPEEPVEGRATQKIGGARRPGTDKETSKTANKKSKSLHGVTDNAMGVSVDN